VTGTPPRRPTARVGELTQLRVQDIEQQACGPVLPITPDAGTVKTGTRTVPVHPHLVKMGVLEYVEAVGAGRGRLCSATSPSRLARSSPRWLRELKIPFMVGVP
jgi:hypothetical protein